MTAHSVPDLRILILDRDQSDAELVALVLKSSESRCAVLTVDSQAERLAADPGISDSKAASTWSRVRAGDRLRAPASRYRS
jgi:hypothetical protein